MVSKTGFFTLADTSSVLSDQRSLSHPSRLVRSTLPLTGKEGGESATHLVSAQERSYPVHELSHSQGVLQLVCHGLLEVLPLPRTWVTAETDTHAHWYNLVCVSLVEGHIVS